LVFEGLLNQLNLHDGFGPWSVNDKPQDPKTGSCGLEYPTKMFYEVLIGSNNIPLLTVF